MPELITVILAFVVFLAGCLIGTVFIFRNKAKAARARRAARIAAEAEATSRSDADDDRSTRRSSFASSRRESEYALEDGEGDELSMVEIRSTRSGVWAPPAYRERPRTAETATSATVSTSTSTDGTPKPRTLSSRLSRIPSAIGSFLSKRVQPGLGGNNVSTDELQTRAAEAQLEAARNSRNSSRRASTSSSMFAFSPRRTSSSPAVYPPPSPSRRSRLQSEPPSAETVDQVRQIRRALSDAGLLFAPPRSLSDRRLSGVSSSRPAVLATMHEDRQRQDDADEEAEREIYRQERRARRRRRRERERQRFEDEAGLPTYSREAADGDVVLQRADGWKSEEEDDEAEEETALDALEDAMRARDRQAEPIQALAGRSTGRTSASTEPTPSVHIEERRTAP